LSGAEVQEITARAAAAPAEISLLRAWFFLVGFSIQRQARLRQMVWIALALLVIICTVVGLVSMGDNWSMKRWPWGWVRLGPTPAAGKNTRAGAPKEEPGDAADILRGNEPAQRPVGPMLITTRGDMAAATFALPAVTTRLAGWPLGGSPLPALTEAIETAVAGANWIALDNTPFHVFSTWVIFSVFLGFVLPICSLSFATEALGGERESRSLLWLLTRPLPRWSVYLAKFVAILPWSLGMNLGGFIVICLLGGAPGRLALRLYWPAVLGGTVAFCALFHLMSALFRRAAVLSLVYAFFLEWLVGSMPGTMKRASLSFYTRCLMFDEAAAHGLAPDRPSIYLPVSGATAWIVLSSLTVAFLVVGMVVFSRGEYQDLA
jgi:ABC-2 type transport system permease protein